jgi:hypothetical protein
MKPDESSFELPCSANDSCGDDGASPSINCLCYLMSVSDESSELFINDSLLIGNGFDS